MIFDLLIQLI